LECFGRGGLDRVHSTLAMSSEAQLAGSVRL
jgi:hypothetical protein